ncbi:hypothetical protein [Spirosoma pollinicola]|uniref:Outer membrane protein beta-barrel domain-containing protein n=1 Tax=Spirosoma pollinicola TaxID=2057025 RepID=A0A2K8YTX0_9BACT|nr:hypothetical protein [Spirosoma pollinicola]AUD01085.1 hypothetical protein CWM47_04140 [Spirosoma pollinicola]
MNRYTLILIGLLMRVSVTQAQQLMAVNTTNRSTDPAAKPTSPNRAKATESPMYLKIYGFYSLLSPGTELNYSYSQAQSITPTTFSPTNKSLGAGPRVGAGIGYIVSDFINLGIDADILLGTDLKIDNNFFSGSDGSTRYTTSLNTSLKVLSITPNITFKALSRPAFYIYNRLGLVGGVVLDYKVTSLFVATPSKGAATTTATTNVYNKNSLALGYQVALGIQFRLSQNLRGFAEVVAYNQSFKPQEVQSTGTSTTNGIIKLLDPGATAYKDLGDYNKSNPSEQPSFNVAINSVGVGAGLIFRF